MIALAQQQPGGPFESLDWLVQAAIVVIFFVLPVIRTVLEKSRRAEARPKAPTRKPTAAGPQGRDLWRELLAGTRTQEPPRTSPAAPPRAEPAPRARPPATSGAPARRAAPLEPIEAAPAGLPHLGRPLQPAASEPAPAPPIDFGRRALERLESDVSRRVLARPSAEALVSVREVDPATLDDELLQRWGEVTEEAGTAAAGGLRGEIDWRRAVLLSELLSPPLALRGAPGAWPGAAPGLSS